MLHADRPSGDRQDPHLVSLGDPTSFEAEQYRRLRQRIEDLRAERGLRLVAVTSAVADDGKTLTSINLAGTLAQAPHARVLLIDADLRRPSVARQLALDEGHTLGLAAALESPGRLRDFVCPSGWTGLSVLPNLTSRGDAYELLSSPRLPELLKDARDQYDYVILDTPPLVPVPDSGLLCRAVDGYIVVVSANRTPRKLLGEALNLLDPDSVIGLVFNRDERPLFGYYRTRYRQYFRSYVRSLDRQPA